MSVENVIKSWKDPLFLETLTDEARTLVPSNPAGEVKLPEQNIERNADTQDPPGGNPRHTCYGWQFTCGSTPFSCTFSPCEAAKAAGCP